MSDIETFKREVNGIEDWVAYLEIDPDRLVPVEMYEHIPDLPEDTVDLKITDICWNTVIGDKTIIRCGYLNGSGTLVDEEQFMLWWSCKEESDNFLTFEEYAEMASVAEGETP